MNSATGISKPTVQTFQARSTKFRCNISCMNRSIWSPFFFSPLTSFDNIRPPLIAMCKSVSKLDSAASTSSPVVNIASHLSGVQRIFVPRTTCDVIGCWEIFSRFYVFTSLYSQWHFQNTVSFRFDISNQPFLLFE